MENGSKPMDETDVLGFFEPKLDTTKRPAAKEKPISQPTVERYYKTTSNNRGLALVFCNKNFASLPEREGTDKDRDAIWNTLEELAFKVHVYDDLTKEQILDTLNVWSQEKHHVDSDCLVVVVMSYGADKVIYAKDKTYDVDTLWKFFVGNACPSLIGKPKMFFLQACCAGLDGTKPYYADKPIDIVDSGCQKTSFFIPTVADLLVMYDGSDSWRDSEQRSCFIQSLCRELKENESNRELLTLLTRVIRRTIYGYELLEPNNKPAQVPCLVSMLTKSFYFNKKANSRS